MEVLRSVLVVPGNRPDMLEKARHQPADAVLINLEDAVPLAEKERAREIAARVVKGYALRGQKLFVQANSLVSGLALGDLEAMVCPHIDGVAVSKVSSEDEVRELESLIATLEKRRGMAMGAIKLMVWIETAMAVARALELARASPRTIAVTFGAEDFTLDMGIERSEEGGELMYPRTAMAVAAKAAGVHCIDTPYVNFRDTEGLVREASLVRRLGFTGKLVIHPSQIEPVNRAFSPTEEEVAYARRVVQTFEEAVAQGRGVTSLDGKMIEEPTYQRALATLKAAEAVSSKVTPAN